MRKRIIFYLIALTVSMVTININAQSKIGISYIFSDITTHNLSIFKVLDFKDKHQFSVGLKYHYNDDSTKPLFRYYYRNLYSNKILNNIGITFEYRLYFNKNKLLQPYLFYHFQYSRLGSKYKDLYMLGGSNQVFEKQTTLDPINFFENHIGLGININFNPIASYFMGLAVGGTFFTDLRDLDDLNNGTATQVFVDSRTEEFSWLFNTGLILKVGKPKPKKRKYK